MAKGSTKGKKGKDKPELILYRDSREKEPLPFPKEVYDFDEVRTMGLPFGDYSAHLDGKPIPIVFERKAIGDLYGTLTKGHQRFKREIQRCANAGWQFILIIECPMSEVLKGYKHTRFSGLSCIRQIFTLWLRYDVYPVFCEDREQMSRFIYETFDAARRSYSVVNKEEKGEGKSHETTNDETSSTATTSTSNDDV